MTEARLLSVSTPESGAWLHTLPIANLGLRMDNSTIRVSVGLRLSLPVHRYYVESEITVRLLTLEQSYVQS